MIRNVVNYNTKNTTIKCGLSSPIGQVANSIPVRKSVPRLTSIFRGKVVAQITTCVVRMMKVYGPVLYFLVNRRPAVYINTLRWNLAPSTHVFRDANVARTRAGKSYMATTVERDRDRKLQPNPELIKQSV